ncbi:MerR family transcriptional regulator [Polycyclovorans algicola]|uniref:MerR family transcriptional regulator n=1 Tax=Polycyclovorans algicola TaxID=616992 RepID=UPI0004A7626A|nr:MerR family transcriptional regulator [Polycyclovorans algicola]
MQTLTIGAIAKQAGVGIDTIRYYERSGLLPKPQRRASGYRDYSAGTVKQLRFIRRAKDLGFTLEEIGELMSLSVQRDDGVKGVKAAAETRLAVVETKIKALQRIRLGLKKLIAACPGDGRLDQCPIIAALSTEDAA